jgi:SAM-dependent methyltransferase
MTPAKTSTYQSANYNKWEFKNGLYQKHLELYLNRMSAHLQSAEVASVLDAGCGEGVVYRAMRKRGFAGSWSGFDFNGNAAAFAAQLSPECEWRQADIFQLPYESGSVDLVFCSEVLEHVPNPELALAELARVSRRWLLISVPCEPVFRILTRISITLRLGGDPGHVNFWRPAEFRKFVSQAGELKAWERTTIYQIALIDLNK